jgi:hypothetical protein
MLICFRCLLKLTSFSLSRAPIGPIFVKSHSDRTWSLLLPPVLWALQSPRKFLSISLGGLWWAPVKPTLPGRPPLAKLNGRLVPVEVPGDSMRSLTSFEVSNIAEIIEVVATLRAVGTHQLFPPLHSSVVTAKAVFWGCVTNYKSATF